MSNTNNALLTPYSTSEASTLLTVPELAEYLSIGRNKAYDLLRNNVISGFRLGASWRVSKIAVDQYILKSSKII